MPTAAHAALNVGRTERATHWAQELLDMARGHENDQGYGSAIHDGNIVLGRIAAESGDIEAGKQHLLAAGNTPGSCTLNSFGPDMLLLAGGLTAVAIIGKQACALVAFGEGVDRVSVGIGMIPRGEVGLIFATVGTQLTIGGERVISPSTYAAVILMVMVTTLMTPPALSWSLARGEK